MNSGRRLAQLARISVTELKGVGQKRADALAAMDPPIETVLDLLTHYPRRYIDRSQQATIRELKVGDEAMVLATVKRVQSRRTRNRRALVEIDVFDGTSYLRCTFFNQPWRAKQLAAGREAVFFGRVEMYKGRRQMTNPVVDLVGDKTGKIIPVYPQSEKAGLTTWDLEPLVSEALARAGEFADPLPEEWKDRLDVVERTWAFRQIHEPESMAAATAARTRLVVDELVRLQVPLVMRKRAVERESKGIQHNVDGELVARFHAALPFPLTGAQQKAIAEIADDLAGPHPMHRLLQGDVGAGKAQPLDAGVLTPNGFRLMGELSVGDEVITPSGEVTTVTGVYPQGVRPVWRLVLADGASVECDAEHLWPVNTSVRRFRGQPEKALTTEFIRTHLTERNGASRWHLPMTSAAEFDSHAERPLEPYLLGLLLGDGCFRDNLFFTSADPELVDAVDALLPDGCFLKPRAGGPYDYSIRCRPRSNQFRPHPIAAALAELGLRGHRSSQKFIPDAYKQAPIKVRHAVLQGLLDTDGTLRRTGRDVSFSSTSPRLAQDVEWLVRSLAGRANVRLKRRASGDSYHVSIQLPVEFEPFRLDRKARRVRPRTKYAHPGRAIRAVEFVGHKAVQCISVAHPTHQYVTDHFVPTHNTVVAVTMLLMAVQGGYQGALMAPTEVLAEQHELGVRDLLRDLQVPDTDPGTMFGERPLTVALLTNRTTAKEREKLQAGLADGSVDILIGTHALIEEAVAFKSLGAIVIDEQHRFGVEQRAALRGKGQDPDVLVMTATPIPRTAAMTVYGDLDVTVLDELPPGRTPVATKWVRGDLEQSEAYRRVEEEVAAGRQAYVVCPLVEGSERVQAKSATEEYERLGAAVWPDLRLGLLHGQMPSKEKEKVMSSFRNGDLDVLVATTVIEVGVDVPNATVMLIEDAVRFGIAQLHQLRGRVGRGAAKSWCYLLGEATTPDAEERLQAMERTTDGFELAEVDLDIRGEGTVLGTRQKGRSDLRLASLRRDREWVGRAREVAFDIVDSDPTLRSHDALAEEVKLLIDEDEAEFLFKS